MGVRGDLASTAVRLESRSALFAATVLCGGGNSSVPDMPDEAQEEDPEVLKASAYDAARSRAREVFRRIDVDNSGDLDRDEIVDVFGSEVAMLKKLKR